MQTWANFNEVTGSHPIIGNYDKEQDVGFNLNLDNKDLRFQISNPKGNGNIVNVEFESDIKPNNWYHIAAIKKDNNVYLFLNGEQKASESISIDNYVLSDASHDVKIGYQPGDQATGYFCGFLQDIRISQSVDFDINGFDKPDTLLPTECGDPPSFCPIFLLQSNDENNSSSFSDSGPNGYRIIPGEGNPTHSNESTIYGRSSIKFTDDHNFQVTQKFNILHFDDDITWTLQFWVNVKSIEIQRKIIGTKGIDTADYPVYFLHNTSGSNGIKAYYAANNKFGFEIFQNNEKVLDLVSVGSE